MVSPEGNLKLFIKPPQPSRELSQKLKLKPLILELILDLSEIINNDKSYESSYKIDGSIQLSREEKQNKRPKTMMDLIAETFRGKRFVSTTHRLNYMMNNNDDNITLFLFSSTWIGYWMV